MEQKNDDARTEEPGSWASRPYLSGLLRLFIFAFPAAASLATAVIMARLLSRPNGGLSTAMWWAAILGTSLAVLFVFQRLVRRLLPLAVLLRLTLTFPDRAPSRYRVVRQSGDLAELRHRLWRARQGDGEEELQQAAEAIISLVAALSGHDRQTRGHSERVRVFTDMLAEELKIPVPDRDRLRWAALLHDVGKLEVPAEILNKAGPLDELEWDVVRQHPVMGMRLIGPLAAWLGPQAKTIEHHHEHYAGDGYPDGIGGEEISMGGRIVSVADAYETMTASRSYKKPLSAAAAREELSRCAGKQFDPGVVRAMMNISLGRLWWRVGVLSWLAQIPLVGPASRFFGRTMQTAGGTAGAAAAAAVIGVAGITVPLAMHDPIGGSEYQQAAVALPEAEAPLRFPRVPSPKALGLDEEPVEEPIAAVTYDDTGDAVPAPDASSGSESSGGSADSGNNGSKGGGGAGGDQEAADEDPGDEGGGGSGGGTEDPNLIRFVVETVVETVDELPTG